MNSHEVSPSPKKTPYVAIMALQDTLVQRQVDQDHVHLSQPIKSGTFLRMGCFTSNVASLKCFFLRMPQSVLVRNRTVKEWDQKLHADHAVCATFCYVSTTHKSCTEKEQTSQTSGFLTVALPCISSVQTTATAYGPTIARHTLLGHTTRIY